MNYHIIYPSGHCDGPVIIGLFVILSQGNVDLEDLDLEDFNLDLDLDDPDFCPSGLESNVSVDDSSCSSSNFEQLLLEAGALEVAARNHCDPAELVPRVKALTVKTISKRPNGKRKFDKRHYCVYCKKAYCKIARHLAMKHAKETDVALALGFPKGSRRRSVLLEQIRNKGDFHHNLEVLKQGDGELVTWKSPSVGMAPSEFLPCQYCLGFFSKRVMWEASRRLQVQARNRSRQQRAETSAVDFLQTSSFAECERL